MRYKKIAYHLTCIALWVVACIVDRGQLPGILLAIVGVFYACVCGLLYRVLFITE
jgi:hypothetical protein